MGIGARLHTSSFALTAMNPLAIVLLLLINMLKPGTFVVSQAAYLAEDMVDSEIDEVVEKGREFENYLEKG